MKCSKHMKHIQFQSVVGLELVLDDDDDDDDHSHLCLPSSSVFSLLFIVSLSLQMKNFKEALASWS